MIPHLPLAADLGDLIFLLVVLGGGLLQWLASRGKKPTPEDASPYEDPFPSSGPSRRDEPEPSWDELMEALGQKPGEVRPEQIEPTPPPVPAASPPPLPTTPRGITVVPTPTEPEPAALSDHVRTMLAALESRSQNLSPAAAYETQRTFPTAGDKSRPRPTHSLSAILRNRSELRRAVVLQEILQPPLALR